MSWLVGSWTFEDRALPAAGFEYRETGERTCDWTLDGRYIECQSVGRTKKGTRTYRHYWTWNETTGRIELLSLFGNTPSRGLAIGTISDDGLSIELQSPPETEDGVTSVYRYEIRHDGADGYVWRSSRNQSTDPLGTWTERFIDTARRAR